MNESLNDLCEFSPPHHNTAKLDFALKRKLPSAHHETFAQFCNQLGIGSIIKRYLASSLKIRW
jgi:hypothetical protein